MTAEDPCRKGRVRAGTGLASGGPMALPSGESAPREPATSVLYQIILDHYKTFRIEAARLRDREDAPRLAAP